jgi:uncharacterized flavoprotein (TIGR03862 family)
VQRYGARRDQVAPWLARFDADAVRAWIDALGVQTFIGSSGRVFPTDMKAAPLLRAWLHRLREAGVQLHMRHRWLGWDDKQLLFSTPDGALRVQADAVVLALGGGSWARLGSDGAWVSLLMQQGVPVAPLQPSNCGFDTDWSAHFSGRYAGEPLTTVAITSTDASGAQVRRQGQFVVTASGVEGSLIYALSAALREQIAAAGSATIYLDLVPDFSAERVHAEVTRPRGARSMSTHLQSRLGIKGVKSGLLRECLAAGQFADTEQLAAALKMLPVVLKYLSPAKWSTGKRQPAAICSPPALPAGAPRAKARWPGWPASERNQRVYCSKLTLPEPVRLTARSAGLPSTLTWPLPCTDTSARLSTCTTELPEPFSSTEAASAARCSASSSPEPFWLALNSLQEPTTVTSPEPDSVSSTLSLAPPFISMSPVPRSCALTSLKRPLNLIEPEPSNCTSRRSPLKPLTVLSPLPRMRTVSTDGSTSTTCSGKRLCSSMPLTLISSVLPFWTVSILPSKRSSPRTVREGTAPWRSVMSMAPSSLTSVMASDTGRVSLVRSRPAVWLRVLTPWVRKKENDKPIKTKASSSRPEPIFSKVRMASSISLEQGEVHLDVAPGGNESVARQDQA